MINFENEVFTIVYDTLKNEYGDALDVTGEYTETPISLPCVTIDEISNIPYSNDGADYEKYASVQYSVQIFTEGDEKKSQAKELYEKVNNILRGLNLIRISYITKPTIYNSNVYQISAIHEGVIDEQGFIYRR